MERLVRIRAKDGKLIYGALWSPSKNLNNRPLVLIVHGMTGNRNESKNRNLAKSLYEKGIASLRISLYSWEPGARSFTECSLIEHADDLNTVYTYLKKKGVTKIVGVGHSLGFPSLLASSVEKLSGIVSWDGTTEAFLRQPTAHKRIRGTKYRFLPWGNDILVGEHMINRVLPRGFSTYAGRLARFGGPLMVFVAEKSILKRALLRECKSYLRCKTVLVRGADHNFTQRGCEEAVVKQTVEFCVELL